jgi:hypothetical protein
MELLDQSVDLGARDVAFEARDPQLEKAGEQTRRVPGR